MDPHRRPIPVPVLGLAGLAGAAALLELVPRLLARPGGALPPLSAVLSALAGEVTTPAFSDALLATAQQWAIGLLVAVVAGVAAGVLIGSSGLARALTASTIEFLRPIPSVALVPLAVLMFGTQLRSAVLLIGYAAFWQVLVQTLAGVQDVDPVAEQTARCYGLGRWARIRHVLLPSALPFVATGVRLAASVALILAVTAELVIGSPGLGQEIAAAQSGGATDLAYGLILVAGLLGLLVNVGLRQLERRLLKWHVSVRREVPA